MHEVLVNRLGGLSLPRKSVVRLTDRPDMTFDVYNNSTTILTATHYPFRSWMKLELDAIVNILSNSNNLELNSNQTHSLESNYNMSTSPVFFSPGATLQF